MALQEVPKRITNAARERVRASEAKKQREQVRESAEQGNLLTAEPDEHRKIHRFQAVAGVDRKIAIALAHGEDPAKMGLDGDARLGAERIQGRTTDFVGVAFLDSALAAASCVARVIFRDGQPQGSGFLISDRLFLTNNHVISSEKAAEEFLLEFNYELDPHGHARSVTRFALAPKTFFLTNSEDDLDYTVVAVGDRESGAGDPKDFGFCPLTNTDDKHLIGEFVNIIQHPDGDYKQVVLRENQLVTRLDKVLHYVADTSPGSSGSPVFNDQWEAVALHHWGEPYRQVSDGAGQMVDKEVNEGIRISAIVQALEQTLSNLQRAQVLLLKSALKQSFRYPSRLGLTTATSPSIKEETSPSEPMNQTEKTLKVNKPIHNFPSTHANSDGSVTLTIPLEITVRIPGLNGSVGNSSVPSNSIDSGRAEAVTPDPNYLNRKGYDPNFLSDFTLPIPKVTDRALGERATLLNPARGADPYELKYEHFSIVINRTRKMAYVTAVNIDGQQSRRVIRETGRVSDDGTRGRSSRSRRESAKAAEASEKWYIDERIDEGDQTNQSLYSNQQPTRIFDRGHQVRREDPVWGSDREAERANADTFHFTNCCPQESRFNQQQQYWQGIENYVLDNAREEDAQLCVFTGPVFAASDPRYREVRIPLQFFKVIARLERGELKATAFLADQSELLTRLPERLSRRGASEAFGDLGRVREYQTTVEEIEEITGLDFGLLRDYDTFREAESLTGRFLLLEDFADIQLS
ncbi:DNA/RNA non-specific endonuclease [Trichocoleus desertorum AS-A10]|uniref:DNA/RNA non-specific endonuclease n=1 Tax=Trichocoleus desertorum TaxID=1481672 RepID=UPI003299F9F9